MWEISEPPGSNVLTFNHLSVALHPLKRLMRNCLKTLKHKIGGFVLDYMDYYREEIFKGPQGSVFLIHLRYATIISLQRRHRGRLVFFC